MASKAERAKVAILRALDQLAAPAGAARIAALVTDRGVELQPRSVRFYLQKLDREGLTRFVSRRRGRELTERGREEIARAGVMAKLGFVSTRVGELGYRMTFDPRTGQGTLVTNVAEIDAEDLPRALVNMEPVYRSRLAMGFRLAFAREGETLGDHRVAPGCVAFGTVCSIAVNGVLLKAGIPVTSRFGGLLELRNGKPDRFVELIEYGGTTLDPLEIFIRSGMTRVQSCARTGSGIVCASFREVPSAAVPDLQRILRQLRRHDFDAVLEIGRPSHPLLDIPVSEGHTGILVLGGLNPVAALHEAGVRLNVRPLAGLCDYARFQPFREIALLGRRSSPLID
jgi:repressor of nif and glnA expression